MDKHLLSSFQFLDYKVDFIKYEVNYDFKFEEQLTLDLS